MYWGSVAYNGLTPPAKRLKSSSLAALFIKEVKAVVTLAASSIAWFGIG
ncbi:MAG: hypothetical protein ACRD8Z_05120 [Nitrososphaeraceae archaeon]